MLTLNPAGDGVLRDGHNVAAALSAGPEMAQTSWELVLVDASLARRGLLPASDTPGVRVVQLNDSADVLSQITDALASTGKVRALHVITHGESGALRLGNQSIDAETLTARSAEVTKWSASLTDDAVIALYGCDVAEGASGRAFVQALATRSGATVAASDDLTGTAARGGDWKLEYVTGKDPIRTLSFGGFDGLLATFTVTTSGGTATHVVGTGASVVDASVVVSSSDGAATYTSATVSIGTGYRSGEDVLTLPSAPVGFVPTFNAGTGTLTVTAAGGKTAAQFQAALRLVTYQNTASTANNLSARAITFSFGGVSSTRSLAPDLPVDQKIQDRIVDAFHVIDEIGQQIVSANAQPYRNDNTEIPVVGSRITDLLYPNSPNLDANGNAVADLSRSIQPAGIGSYLQMESTVSTYFSGAGTSITDLAGLQSALQSKLNTVVTGSKSVVQVDAAFTKPAATDARRIDLTVTVLTAKGEVEPLQLEALARDLNMKFGDAVTVQVGGGADIAFTISLDLAGHTYGTSATAIPAANVGVNFTRLNAFAGFTVGGDPFDVTVGAIGGTISGASGYLGARIPVNLGGGGNTRTLASWATDGSDYAGFGTLAASASISLPISASIGGVSATTANTKVVFTDSNLFDGTAPSYVATDYENLQYFAGIRIDDVINQVLKAGDLFNALDASGENQFGVYVPTLDDTTLGDLFDFKALFESAIGSQIDVYEPVLNTPGRDVLTDYRLPLSDDTTPKGAMWSDLRAGFTFGVVINEAWPIHTVTIAADDTRATLDDLVTDLNAALTTAGLDLIASNVKNKISIKASDVSVQRFAVVPVAPAAGRLSPTAPPSDLSTLTLNTPQYYTVTGSTTGSVVGTSYYTVGSPLAAAAVHAGILDSGETGVVKVTRVGNKSGLIGSGRNSVTSTDGSGDSYLIESAASDLRRLGLIDFATPLSALEKINAGALRATLPLQANLSASASFNIKAGSSTFTINVPDNGRSSVLDTLGDIQSALTTAGVGASTLGARLVDAGGNVLEDAPESGTDYYLQLYIPEGSAWTTFSVEPKGEETAHQVLPAGFLVGDTAARPRPTALASFDDFSNATLFPGLTISPVYDAGAGTVTLEFTASESASPTVKAAFDLALGKLGKLQADDENLAFTPVVTSQISFGLQFKIGPEKPVSLPSGAELPTNGQLTGDAAFSLNFVLQDKFAVTVPQAWTTANAHVQDLISDVNRALQQTTNGSSQTEDITDRFIARRVQDGLQLELLTATQANAGSPYTLTHTSGELSADVDINFSHDGVAYTVTLTAEATEGNTSFGDLVLDLNEALGTATNGDGDTISLTSTMFFTTIASAAGAANSSIYLYATAPADPTWPASVVLTAGRTSKSVTELGFDDSGEEGTDSVITARAPTGDAVLVDHSNDQPLASGTVDITFPSFSGTVPYGFNTLAFDETSGGVTAKAAVALVDQASTVDQVASSMATKLDQTLTRANGTSTPRAVLTLGTITTESTTILDTATIDITIADFSDTTIMKFEPIGVPIPVAGQISGRLTADRTINFLHEGSAYAVTVTVAESSANTTFTDLVAQYNAELETATKTVNGVASVVDASGLFTITAGEEANQVVVSVATRTANPDFATVTFLPGASAFGDIAAQGSFGLSSVADSLMDVIPLLDALQSDLDLFSAFKLPLIDTRVNDLIDVKGDLLSKVESLRDVTITGPAQIAGAISQSLGIPSGHVAVMYDEANSAYRIDLQWETGVATAKALDLTLADFYRFTGETPPAGLTSINDAGSSSPLEIKIKAVTTLAMGIDLTDPDAPRTFLYGHDGTDDLELADGSANGTSVKLEVEARADDISFTAALGAFGIFVRGGSAVLGGAARTFNDDPIYTFDEATNQLHFARDNDAAVLSVTLGEAGEKYYLDAGVSEEDAYDTRNYTTGFEGTVEANLPLFTPTEFINPFTNRTERVRIEGQGMTDVHPGGNVFQLLVPDLQAYADASLDLIAYQRQISDVYALAGDDDLTGPQQEVVDDLQMLIDALKTSEVLDVFTPDVDDANSGVRAPTLLDLVRDPAILVDGIDVALGSIETGLSALDNLNIPLIGNVLGDAVDGVFDWRRGWLLDLKHDLRGQGEAFFETLKGNVYDFLGPTGLDILLKDNGVRSVDGMIKADSRDDVTLDFLDADGNKMTGLGGYGAEAVEFKVRLGQVLLDTGADLSFDFDALQPAFSLKLEGGLTFKLGWDMTIGFGISIEDGFYMVTDSDPVANELELRFEAGLSGRQTGFTVGERSASLTGYSVKDAAGNWVLGPRKGNGSADIIDVMPVDVNGDDYDFSQGLPPSPEDCAMEVAAGNPQPVYWVVAVDDGAGNAEPAYLDKLGQYRPMAGDTWSDTNGGDDARNPDLMVQFDQTAPFAAFGSLFAFNLSAIDNIRMGLEPLGDAEYFYDGTKPQITSGQRNDADDGVNRNNTVPTRIAGRIGVNISDPSAAAEDYVARPGPTPTGFMLMDGANAFGGEPVLDDVGALIPVRMIGDDWYVMEPDPDGDPGDLSPELVEAFLINEDQSPNRITFSEIQEAGTSIFELKLNAEAVLNLKMTLSVSDNANIPRITAELNIDWRTDSMKPPANPFAADEEQKRDLVPEVGVNNIRLDLGSFLTKFIKPIAGEVDKTMKPLDPLIDVLMASLPVLSDIAGRPIRLTTLLSTFGGPKGQAVATMLEMVVLVRQLSGVMAAVPNDVNVYLPIGNFWLAKVGAGPTGQPGLGTQIYYDNSEVTAPSITQRNQSMIANSGQALNSVTNALGKLDQMDRGSSSQPGVAQQDRGGFSVPILQDPMTVFKLMMGQNVPLVTFSLPKLDFNFSTDIPLARIVILNVGLRLNLQMKGQLAVGYDTYGIKLFKDSGNAQDLLEGFYVSDRANADGTGADVDEFYLRATIALYGEIDLYLAKAGIEGGFTFTASINLNDPDNDGKLRVMEAVDLVKYTGNPLDLADLHFSGEIYARYYYWVGLKIWTPWKTYKITLTQGGKTFARMTVFSFTRDGRDGPPVMGAKVTTITEDGTETPNSLLLNFGPNSAKRISNEDPLKLKDAAERVVIWNDSAGSGTIHVKYLNYSGSYVQTFTGISRVVMYGGEGNDSIDASGLNGIPVEFDGGAGNDTIYLGSGSASVESILKGGLGADVIRATGGGKMRIEGDEGDDSLEAGTNAYTTLDGGGGNDTVTGGGGSGGQNTFKFSRSFGKDNLVLNSTALVNLLDFIDSSLPLNANLHAVESVVKAGDTNSATFDFDKVTEIRGSDGRDTFNVTDPVTRSANDGKGVVLAGGPSDDTYNINANDVSDMHADGITIDDDIEPITEAAVGDVVLDDCGHIKKIKMASQGLGYVQPPDVIIEDSAGTGARAVASIDKLGRVTGIYVLSKGDNYVSPTITLVRRISTGDKINFNSQTQHTVALDRQANGGGDSQLKLSGKGFKWVGNEAPGVVREITHDVNEIDKVSVTLPNSKLEINDAIDIQDKFEVIAKEFDQRAAITADTVSITTDRGFAADYPINATNNGDVTLRVNGAVDPSDITTQAVVTANVVGGEITGFNIASGGSGYRFAPTIIIDDPRGAGARATTTITNGVVTAITLIDGGTGYLSTPAPVVSVAHPDSIQLNNNLSSSTVGSLPGDGDGRGTVTLRAEAGAINSSGDVFFPTGSNVEWEHGDYRYTSSKTLNDITPTTYPETAGGQGATAVAVLDGDGRVTGITVTNAGSGYSRAFLPSVQIEGAATATAIVDDGTGQITGFKITYPGEGYSSVPKVKIVSNGFGKLVGENSGATEANRKHIKAAGGSLIATAFSGIGSGSKPLKTDVENMVAQTFDDGSAIYVLEKDGVRIGEMQHINGISTVNANIGVTTFGGSISLGQPVQQMNASGELLWQDANKTIPIYAKDESGKIIYKGGRLQAGDAQIKLTADDIDVNSYISAQGGSLVLQPVQPDAVIGLNGTRARATLAISNGQVTGTSELWSGRGYGALPLITIAAPGERAFGVASVLNGQLQNINVTFGGTNYNAQFPPTITLVGGGLNGGAPTTPATVVPVYTDGVVTGVTISNGGAGYYTAPEVVFALPGVQATATSQIVNGKISEIQILNPGSNYQVAPDISIAAPNDFTLEKEEVEYFQDGFGNILIGREDGRHVFYSADAGFVDGVTLRGPRAGGTVELENIRSSDGPVVIIGSGHTLNMTSVAPAVTGTFVEIDDNIVVHDDVNAVITGTTSYVSVFGAGKGKIDGVAGSDDENLTINDVGNVLVTGAIGSTYPINDLTINSSGAGTINLQQAVTLEGDLRIIEGGDVNFGGNLVIGGDLIIDEAASVSFAGTVTVTGDIIIRKATTVTFAKNVSAGGSVGIGEPNDPTAIEGVTFAATARLDVAGTVDIFTTDDIVFGNRVGQLTAPAGITLRSDLGDVSFQASVNVPAGEIEIRKARDITFAQELTALVLDIQDASGQTRFERASVIGTMDVISTSLVQIKNRLDITTGSATLTTNDVDFAGGNGSINYTGGGSSTLTIRPRTVSRDITIGSPPGVFSALDISDVDLAAIGATFAELAIGNSGSGSGTVTIGSIGSQQGAGNSQLVTSTRIHGGAINVVQAIDSAAQTGFLKLVARTGNITIGARINGTVAERNAEIELQTLAGAVLINQPITATDELRIFSAGAVTEGASGYVDVPNLGITAGAPITMTHASNNVSQIAMNAGNHAISFRNDTAFSVGTVDVVTGLNSGSTDITLTSVGGTVTQTQPITAAGLLLQGTGGTFTLTNAANNVSYIAAVAQAVSYVDADNVAVYDVAGVSGITTVGNTSITGATDVGIGSPIVTTTGNIVIDANNGTVSAGALGDLTTGGSGTITIDATDDINLNDVTSGGALTARAENNVTLVENVSSGAAIVFDAAGGDFAQASDKVIAAGGVVTIGASQSVTTRTINAAGNVTGTAGTGFSVLGPITTTAAGNVELSALGGNVTMSSTLGAITSAGSTTLTATQQVTADQITAGTGLSITGPSGVSITDNVSTLAGPISVTAASGAITQTDNTMTAAAGLTMTAGAEIDVYNLAAGSDMTLAAGTSATVHETLTTTGTGSLDIDALNGAITAEVGSAWAIAGNVDLDATAALALQAITAAGTLSGNAGTAITLGEELNTGGVVTLDAASGSITMVDPAEIRAGNAVTLTATDDIAVRYILAQGDLNITAGDDISVAVLAAASADGAAVLTAQAGDVTMSPEAEVRSSTTLGISAAQSVQIANAYSYGNATITAGTSVTIDESVQTENAGTLAITAQSGSITMADASTINAAGATTLGATTTITTETVAVAGDLTMTAAGAIAAEGNITTTNSGNVAITSSASTFTQSAGTALTSAGGVEIDATDITLETVSAVGTVDVDASGALTVNEQIITSTDAGTVTLQAGGAFVMASDAEISPAAAVDIDAASATIQKIDAAGNVDIDTTGAIEINEAIATTAGGTVEITSTNASISMADETVLAAAGATTLTAATTVTTETVSAAGNLTITAGTLISAEGNITTTAGGNISATSTGGAFVQSAGTVITSAGTVEVSAISATIETIASTGTVEVVTVGQIAVNEAITTTAGQAILNAGGAFVMSSDSEIVTVGAVDIDAGTAATIQKIDAAGAVDVDAVGAVTLNEAIATTAGGAVDITSSGASITMADETLINSSGATTLTAATTITTETVGSAGDLTINAGGAIRAEGNITSTHNSEISITSTGGAFTQVAGTTITSAATTSISATDAVIETIASAGNVGVVTTDDIDVNESISTTSGSVTLNAGGAFVMGSDASITPAGSVDIDAGGTATIQLIDATGNVAVDAADGIVLHEAIATTADGTVTLASSAGAIEMAEDSRIVAEGATTLTANTAVQTRDITSGGNVLVTAGTSIAFDGDLITLNDSTVTLTATAGSVAMGIGTSINADADVEITAATTATTRAVAAAGNVSVTAGTTVSVLGTIATTADGHVTLDATNGQIAMSLTSAIDASGDATLTSGTFITAADVVAADAVTMTAGSYVSLTGGVVATAGPVTIDAEGGALTMVEGTSITSGGAVALSATTDISTETVSAAGTVTVRAGDGVDINAAINTTNLGDIDIAAADGSIAMAVGSSLGAAGNVILAATDDVTTEAIEAAGDVTITAADSVSVNNDLAAGDDVSIVTTSGPITVALDASIGAGGDVSLNAGGAMQTRLIVAEGSVALTSGATLSILGNVAAQGGTASFVSDSGAITMGADVQVAASGAANFDAGAGVTLYQITADGITIAAGGTSSLNGTLTTADSGAITIGVAGGLTIFDAANIVSDGVVTVSATGGVISYADFATTGDRININSPLTLADDLSMTTGRRGDGTITFAGTINGAHDLTLRSALDIGFNGDVGQTTAPDAIYILAARNVSMPVRVLAGRITQLAGSGTTELSGSIAANAIGGISIKTASVRVSGAIGTATAGAPLGLEGDTIRLTRTARVSAGGDLNFTAGALAMDDGYRVNVNNSAALVLTADQLSLGSRADSLAGSGVIVLQPLSASTLIAIGGTGSAFDVTAAEVGTIAVGFSNVVIGRGQDALHDSGNVGTGAVVVNEDVSFRAPVTIRSAGATGSIKVDSTLSTQGRMSHITLTAGGDVAVSGAVRVARSGHIRLTADADGDRRGAVRVAESTNAEVVTPAGNVLLVGPAVRVGGNRTWANIVSGNSSVFIGTTASQSTAVISNANTTITAKDFLVGGTGRNPALVHLEGNVTVTEDFNLYAAGDIELLNARIVSDQKLNLVADDDVITNNVSLIGKRDAVAIRADFDKNGAGTASTTSTRVSMPTTLDLRTRFSEVRLPTTIVPTTRGEAYVVVGNNTRQTVSGLVYVYVYASVDDTLDASDRVIGTARARITLDPAGSTTFRVRLALPADTAVGSYRLVAEAMPYAQQVNPAGSNISTGPTISVTAPAAA